MADFVSKEKRSRIMRGVKGANTKPEIIVRRALHRRGFRFRVHRKDLPGKPDIVLPRYRTVIFVHGCFWHQHEGCKDGRRPTSNVEFWDKKFETNRARDERNTQALQSLGWHVEVIWECEARDPEKLSERIEEIFAPTPTV